MTYNLTDLQSQTQISGLFIYANNATDGVLIIGFMIAVFFVLFMVLKRFEFTHALVTSAFLCFVISSLLAYAGFMSLYGVLFFLILTAFTTLYIYTTQN